MVDDVLSVSTFDTKDIDYTSAADMEDDGAILGIIKKKVKDKEQERNELIIWIDIGTWSKTSARSFPLRSRCVPSEDQARRGHPHNEANPDIVDNQVTDHVPQ